MNYISSVTFRFFLLFLFFKSNIIKPSKYHLDSKIIKLWSFEEIKIYKLHNSH